jgi:hypothetical protein
MKGKKETYCHKHIPKSIKVGGSSCYSNAAMTEISKINSAIKSSKAKLIKIPRKMQKVGKKKPKKRAAACSKDSESPLSSQESQVECAVSLSRNLSIFFYIEFIKILLSINLINEFDMFLTTSQRSWDVVLRLTFFPKHPPTHPPSSPSFSCLVFF